MTPQIRELLQKMTDFRQEVTHLDRMTIVNEVSRLQGALNEAQGAVNYTTLQIAQPNGSRFN